MISLANANYLARAARILDTIREEDLERLPFSKQLVAQMAEDLKSLAIKITLYRRTRL